MHTASNHRSETAQAHEQGDSYDVTHTTHGLLSINNVFTRSCIINSTVHSRDIPSTISKRTPSFLSLVLRLLLVYIAPDHRKMGRGFTVEEADPSYGVDDDYCKQTHPA